MKFFFIFFIFQVPLLTLAEMTPEKCFKAQISRDNKGNLNAIITDYICSETNVVIPSQIDGATVKGIGSAAFYSYTYTRRLIESVEIPNSVEEIGEHAFQNNALTELMIPSGVKNIKSGAFYGNHLSDVSLPESVTTIEHCSFGKNNLATIKIPKYATVREGAFCYTELRRIEIGVDVNFEYSEYDSDRYQQFARIYNQAKSAGTYLFRDETWVKVP